MPDTTNQLAQLEVLDHHELALSASYSDVHIAGYPTDLASTATLAIGYPVEEFCDLTQEQQLEYFFLLRSCGFNPTLPENFGCEGTQLTNTEVLHQMSPAEEFFAPSLFDNLKRLVPRSSCIDCLHSPINMNDFVTNILIWSGELPDEVEYVFGHLHETKYYNLLQELNKIYSGLKALSVNKGGYNSGKFEFSRYKESGLITTKRFDTSAGYLPSIKFTTTYSTEMKDLNPSEIADLIRVQRARGCNSADTFYLINQYRDVNAAQFVTDVIEWETNNRSQPYSLEFVQKFDPDLHQMVVWTFLVDKSVQEKKRQRRMIDVQKFTVKDIENFTLAHRELFKA